MRANLHYFIYFLIIIFHFWNPLGLIWPVIFVTFPLQSLEFNFIFMLGYIPSLWREFKSKLLVLVHVIKDASEKGFHTIEYYELLCNIFVCVLSGNRISLYTICI